VIESIITALSSFEIIGGLGCRSIVVRHGTISWMLTSLQRTSQ
jgi:hypothetical protein